MRKTGGPIPAAGARWSPWQPLKHANGWCWVKLPNLLRYWARFPLQHFAPPTGSLGRSRGEEVRTPSGEGGRGEWERRSNPVTSLKSSIPPPAAAHHGSPWCPVLSSHRSTSSYYLSHVIHKKLTVKGMRARCIFPFFNTLFRLNNSFWWGHHIAKLDLAQHSQKHHTTSSVLANPINAATYSWQQVAGDGSRWWVSQQNTTTFLKSNQPIKITIFHILCIH